MWLGAFGAGKWVRGPLQCGQHTTHHPLSPDIINDRFACLTIFPWWDIVFWFCCILNAMGPTYGALHHPMSSKLCFKSSSSCWRPLSLNHGEVEAPNSQCLLGVMLHTFECILRGKTGVGPVWDLYSGVIGTINCVYISLAEELCSLMFCDENVPVCAVSVTSSCCWGFLFPSEIGLSETDEASACTCEVQDQCWWPIRWAIGVGKKSGVVRDDKQLWWVWSHVVRVQKWKQYVWAHCRVLIWFTMFCNAGLMWVGEKKKIARISVYQCWYMSLNVKKSVVSQES